MDESRNETAMLIYKIFRSDEWAVLQSNGATEGAPIDVADGFVHFSTADQVVETAAKHFSGGDGLWLLGLDSDALGDDLKWEPSRGGALFPHLYRPLKLSDVLWARPLPLFGTHHVFGEPVDGFVDPGRAQFDAFKALDRDHPIDMLNLVRVRETAAYPKGHACADQGLTGAAAYALYGRDSGPVFADLGGQIIWRGSFQSTLIGPEHEAWDHVFVARYPTAHAFLAMVTDARYQQAVIHRQAAVQTSRLIRCRGVDAGEGFA